MSADLSTARVLVDRALLERARALGINVERVLERALRGHVWTVERLGIEPKRETQLQFEERLL